MIRAAVSKLRKGVRISGYTIFLKKSSKGRFDAEQNLEVSIKKGKKEEHLFFAKVFHGRKPHYGQWVELFGINTDLNAGKRLRYHDSKIEEGTLKLFADSMKEGQMFVEYNDDPETKWQVQHGIPATTSRLGHILFGLGFTWFKDWYYPEGFMEGGMKLHGEKGKKLTEGEKENMRDILQSFIMLEGSNPKQYVQNAVERASEILKSL